MDKSRPFPIHFLFFFLVGLVVFAPVLFAGQAYFDGDLIAQYIPMRTFLRSSVLSGHLPLWCPYLLGGQPFFADPNTQSAYPLTYLFLPFPVAYGFGLFYFTHFLIAGLGMYFWCGALGLSRETRFLGGILFAFSGFFWWEIIHPPLLAAYAWLPWWGGALEKFSQERGKGWAFRSGLTFALIFLAGNFQVTLGALYGGGAYLLFRLLTGEGKSSRRLSWAHAILYFIWGALPLLVLWVPAWEFLERSQRWNGPVDYTNFQADLSLDPRNMAGLLFSIAPIGRWENSVESCLVNAGYLGPASFFLMALGLRGKGKLPLYLAVTAGIALLLSFGKYFPLHRWVCDWVPGFGLMRAPFRYLFLYATGGTLLAAMGFERIFKEGKGIRTSKLPWSFVIYAFLAMGLGYRILWRDGWGILWPVLSLGVGAAVLFWFSRSSQTPWAAKTFILSALLALIPFAWTDATSQWGPPGIFNYLERSAELRWLDQEAKEGRAIIGDYLPCPADMGLGYPKIDLPPDAAYVSRTRIAFGYNPLSLDTTTDLYTLPPLTFFRLMAVRCFATASDKWKMEGFSLERLGKVIRGKNLEDTPFVYSPRAAKVVLEADTQLTAMRDPKFDPWEVSLFSKAPEGSGSIDPRGLSGWERTQDDPDDQTYQVRMAGAAPLVFSEVMYPGWKALVDGKPTEILTANHCFRSLWIPEGVHVVQFRYRPFWLPWLLFGMFLWVISIVVFRPWKDRR